MGPLIFIARTHQIKRKKSQLSLRLMQIQSKREDLAQQISNAQQNKTAHQNMWNMMNGMNQRSMQMQQMMTMYGTQSLFSQLTQGWNAYGQSQGFNPAQIFAGNQILNNSANFTNMMNYQAMQDQMMGQNFMNQMMSQMQSNQDQAELEQLNAIDSQLEQEQTGIETQLKLLQAEEQAVEKQMDQEIKQAAPKFGLSG